MDLGLQEPKDASMQPSKVEGAFGFSVFQFSHLKKMHFLVLVSYAVCGFSSNLVFGFRFLSTMMAVFRIFPCPMPFTVFVTLPRKLHPAVALKL